MIGAARADRWWRARRYVLWGLVAAGGASLVLACAGIIGIDERLPDDLTADSDGIDREMAPDTNVMPPDDGCPASFTCASVPAGWQLASLHPDRRPACANGYESPTNLVVASDGLGCTCKCTETTPGSCAAAGATTTFRDYPAAGCSASTTTYPLTVLDGGCGDLPITTTPAVRVPTPPAGSPACAPDAAPSPLRNGRTCTAQGKTCNDGGTCAGALLPGELLCVTKPGDVACPAGYAKKIAVGTSASGDNRVCGTCTCTPGTLCDAPVLELFKDAGCGSAKLSVPATGSCTNEDAGLAFASYRYSGKAPGCAPSVPPLLDGGVTIQDRRTICCRN